MLETKDLLLKKPVYEDWSSIYANLWSHDVSAKYMLWKPIHTEEQAQNRMRKCIAHMDYDPLSWFVYEKKSNEVIGFAGMEMLEHDVYEDTGIAIGPDFIRKGYGKQILSALYEDAFLNHDAMKFICSCRHDNIACKQLQLSLGFHYIHSTKKKDPRNGDMYVLDYYKLDKKDFYFTD